MINSKTPIYLLQLKKRKDPSAVVNSYIVNNLGTNVRADFKNVRYNELDNNYTIPLHVFMPNELKPIGVKSSKMFIYRVFNIGEIVIACVDKKTNHYKVSSATSADNIDKKLFYEFWSARKEVTRIILDYGKNVWGRMMYIRIFLSPYYRILHALTSDGQLPLDYLVEKGRSNWLEPLFKLEYVDIDRENPSFIIPTIKFRTLQETVMYPIELPDLVVGHIVSKCLNFLVENLSVHRALLKYFELTNTYYLLALDYGELITLPISEFLKKFIAFGKHPMGYDRRLGTMMLLAELSNAEILQKKKTDAISGREELYEKIYPHRDKMLESVEEMFV